MTKLEIELLENIYSLLCCWPVDYCQPPYLSKTVDKLYTDYKEKKQKRLELNNKLRGEIFPNTKQIKTEKEAIEFLKKVGLLNPDGTKNSYYYPEEI